MNKIHKTNEDDLNPDFEDRFIGCLLGSALGLCLVAPSTEEDRQKQIEFYKSKTANLYSKSPTQPKSRSLKTGLFPASFFNLNSLSLFRPAEILAESIVATGGRVEPLDIKQRFRQVELETGKLDAGLNPSEIAVTSISPLGLLHSYGRFDKDRFMLDCQKAALISSSDPDLVQPAVTVAVAVRLLCRDEILPEDLMSAAIDYLPFGLLTENPLRERLLAAQDYIEERQTLVDNILAGDLIVDLFEVDLKNMLRSGIDKGLAGNIAASFYAVTAHKDSFEDALVLALLAGKDQASKSKSTAIITGALAGAFHGSQSIPDSALGMIKDWGDNPDEIARLAVRLHKTARSRELTDYVETGI